MVYQSVRTLGGLDNLEIICRNEMELSVFQEEQASLIVDDDAELNNLKAPSSVVFQVTGHNSR